MKVIVITYAYNAEKTIKRTIQSVLKQTYSNFVYYIIDNGSSDSTSKIIDRYATIDSRIVGLSKDKNSLWVAFEILNKIVNQYNSEDYLCYLDADDLYEPRFMEKMISFMRGNCLDVAACGSYYVNEKINKKFILRTVKKDLFIEKDDFEKMFKYYYPFIRTMWGKLYKIDVLQKGNFIPNKEMSYGGDTIFVMETLRQSVRFGVLSECLHTYVYSEKSASYSFNEKRLYSDRIMFSAMKKFLCDKSSEISKDTMNILVVMHIFGVIDTIDVLQNTEMPLRKKLHFLDDIFREEPVNQMKYFLTDLKAAQARLDTLIYWLEAGLETENIYSFQDIEIIAKIFVSIGYSPDKSFKYRNIMFFVLLIEMRKELLKRGESIETIEQLLEKFVQNIPLLRGLSAEFLVFYKDIVFCVLEKKESMALWKIQDILSAQLENTDKFILDFLFLAINIAAEMEDKPSFVYLKKLRIATFLSLNEFEKAVQELDDWDKILPNDTDFMNFRYECEKKVCK